MLPVVDRSVPKIHVPCVCGINERFGKLYLDTTSDYYNTLPWSLGIVRYGHAYFRFCRQTFEIKELYIQLDKV